jgi:hypothetical protein
MTTSVKLVSPDRNGHFIAAILTLAAYFAVAILSNTRSSMTVKQDVFVDMKRLF